MRVFDAAVLGLLGLALLAVAGVARGGVVLHLLRAVRRGLPLGVARRILAKARRADRGWGDPHQRLELAQRLAVRGVAGADLAAWLHRGAPATALVEVWGPEDSCLARGYLHGQRGERATLFIPDPLAPLPSGLPVHLRSSEGPATAAMVRSKEGRAAWSLELEIGEGAFREHERRFHRAACALQSHFILLRTDCRKERRTLIEGGFPESLVPALECARAVEITDIGLGGARIAPFEDAGSSLHETGHLLLQPGLPSGPEAILLPYETVECVGGTRRIRFVGLKEEERQVLHCLVAALDRVRA